MVFVKDLSNLFISESFQRLLQVSGSENVVLDGTGSIKALTIEGTITATEFVGGGTQITGLTASAAPAGPDTSVQFKDGATTSGSSDFTFDKSTGIVAATSFTGSGQDLHNVHELELMISQQQRTYYKTFGYISGNLATASFYDTSGSNLMFDKKLDYYGSGELSSSLLTRYADNLTLLKTFGYTDGSLSSTIVTEI